MDLITLNNTIVNMRKTVIKAKIHIIRNLVKQIKSLKSKKTVNTSQKDKNERKAERLTKEMNILKKLKRDDIAKFSLANTKSFLPEINPDKDKDRLDELLTNRAYVRLSNSSVLSKDVLKFRKKFPNWEKELPQIIKSLGTKQKRKEEKLKQKRKDERKLQKECKKTSENTEGDADTESNIESQRNFEPVEENSEISDNGNSSDSENSMADSIENVTNQPIISKTVGEGVIKQLDLNELIEQDSSDDEEENKCDEQGQTQNNVNFARSEVKDSFFLGGDADGSDSSSKSDDETNLQDFSTDMAVTKKRNDFVNRSGHFNQQSSFGSRGSGNRGYDRGQQRGHTRGLGGRRGGFSSPNNEFSRKFEMFLQCK